MESYDVKEKREIICNPPEVNSLKGKDKVGLDCEWNNDGPYHVALIQIATKDEVFLFQTCNSPLILPAYLRDILVNEDIIKVGVNIEDDVRRIYSQFRVAVKGWLDLRHFAVAEWYSHKLLQQFKDHEDILQKNQNLTLKAMAMRRSFMPKLGLEKMVSDFLNKKLPKSPIYHILGDWEKYSLSESQMLYAAADAAAGLDVFGCFIELEENREHICQSVQKSIFKYDDPSMQLLPSCNFIDRNKFVEKPFDTKDMRFVLLNRILQNSDQYSHLESDYFGKSNKRKSFTAESNTGISKKKENWMTNFLILVFLIVALIAIICGKKSLG